MNTPHVRGPAAWVPRFADEFQPRTEQEIDALFDDVDGERYARWLVERQFSLTRANGWGSAGQCPARHVAKTPAAGERVCHVVAVGRKAGVVSACTTLQRHVREGVL